MANKFVDDLKRCYASLKDDSGRWMFKPVGLLQTCETSDESIKRIKRIITIINGSDFVSVETKIFISNPTMNITNVNEKINILREQAQSSVRKRVAPYSYSNTVKKINEDNKVFTDILGKTLLKDCIHNRIEDYTVVDDAIDRLISFIGTADKSRDNLSIMIDDSVSECNEYKNNEEFFDILSSIEQYLKERMAIVENAINSDKKFVAYFNYLLSTSSSADEAVERDRERLLKFLNNEDYTTGYVDDASESDDEYEDYLESANNENSEYTDDNIDTSESDDTSDDDSDDSYEFAGIKW